MMWVVFIIAMEIIHKVATSKSVDSHNATLQPESTQHPTSPPTEYTADTAMSGGGGGAPVTHGVGNGVG